MITKFLTEVTTKFNPFSPGSRSVRLFLALIPPEARANGTVVSNTILRNSMTDPSSLQVAFKDGKKMDINCEQMDIKAMVEEVDRHSRLLQKQQSLAE